jgi:membrane-bound metal-dependent hydrolase YbcI (DUF457 family)
MPSPIGHSLIGLSIYTVFTQRSQLYKNWKLIFTSVILANLPDIDYVVVFIFNNPFYHRTFSHSLLFSVLVALAVSRFKIIDFGSRNKIFFYCFCLVFSHALADFFVRDGYYPSKVALFYPIGGMINSPVSLFDPLNWAKYDLFFSIETVHALIREFLLTASLFLLIFFRKRPIAVTKRNYRSGE